ncbi:G-protein coupled receptor moody-like isoform X2 [Scylla paramamosain]|uniref:G-protein coupled receptor moody-like isoform X2 n=1 Tax=Scylla paramamosain TaxID=85552 RepID=UPI003083CFD2
MADTPTTHTRITAHPAQTLPAAAETFRCSTETHIKDMTPDTVLIINLAFADLFYSAISLPFMFTTYYRLSQTERDPWEEGNTNCKVSAFIRYANAIAEWTTLGLMALERCVTIYNFRNCRGPSRFFTTFKTICYCCSIWLLAIFLQLPTFFDKFGTFGYNADFVKCDFIDVNETQSLISPRMVFFALESAVPCVLILIGYLVILFQVYSSSAALSIFGSYSCQRMIAIRRSRTTGVIVRLLFVYLVCVIPICVFNLVEIPKPGAHKNAGIVMYCIYWLQYCINNFIYVVSNGRYRRAYFQFLCWITCRPVPVPALPSTVWQPKRCQIYTLPSSSNLQESFDSRFRTLSECEEARRRMQQFGLHGTSLGSFSSEGISCSLKEAVHPDLSLSHSPISCLSLHHSASLSSTSSLQTLVREKTRSRHLSHSVKQDLKEAGHKLRRTFSC